MSGCCVDRKNQEGQAVSVEERILSILFNGPKWYDPRELRFIAMDVRKLEDRVKQLEEALRRIANTDYRGNRSTESQIAFRALEAKP